MVFCQFSTQVVIFRKNNPIKVLTNLLLLKKYCDYFIIIIFVTENFNFLYRLICISYDFAYFHLNIRKPFTVYVYQTSNKQTKSKTQ